jgi:hypothetical protein
MFRLDAVNPGVDLPADLAGHGAALEFGVATGRIGLSRAARGVPVHGSELSRAMADRLRDEPGGGRVHGGLPPAACRLPPAAARQTAVPHHRLRSRISVQPHAPSGRCRTVRFRVPWVTHR